MGKVSGLLGGTCIAAMCCAAPAYAQQGQQAASGSSSASTEAQPGSSVGDIIVTAQKRSESINKVGISITAASGEMLQQRGISNTADLVKIVPGFNFTQSAYAVPVFTLRGIGFYDTSLGAAPTVSVYVDEVPLPISLMSVGATLDLERVEVLKGPQGTLFGQNATGGAINYIAAKPTSTMQSGADLTYGRFNDVEAKGFVSGPLSDTLTARVAVRYNHMGDWQKSYTRSDSRGESDVFVGRLLLNWKPDDRLSVTLNANGWQDKSDNQAAQVLGVGSTTAAPSIRAYPLPPEGSIRDADWDAGDKFRRNNTFWQLSSRIDYELADWATLTSITAYEQLRRRSTLDADGMAIQNLYIDTPGRSRDFSQEVRLAGDIDPIRYVIGANYAYDHFVDAANPSSAISSYPFRTARLQTEQWVKTYAVFGNLDYRITNTLTLQGGVRYTDQHRRFEGCTYDSGDGTLASVVSALATARKGSPVVAPIGGCNTLGADFLPAVVHDQLNEDNVSWRAGLNWQVTPRTLLYATVSKGYKNGAYTTAGALFAVQYTPAVQESVLAYEAGFKITALNRTLQLNGAAFYYDYSDKQVRGRIIDPVIGPQNALINIPKSRITGAELQATWQPLQGLTINAGGSYVNSKILDHFTNYNALTRLQDFDGQRFPLTPKWQLVADAEYEFALSSTLNAFGGAGATYQSSTNGGLGELPQFAMPAYTLVDLRLGLKQPDGRWKVTGFIRNLGNKKYYTLVSQPGPDTIIGYTGRPRTFGVTLSFRQ